MLPGEADERVREVRQGRVWVWPDPLGNFEVYLVLWDVSQAESKQLGFIFMLIC